MLRHMSDDHNCSSLHHSESTSEYKLIETTILSVFLVYTVISNLFVVVVTIGSANLRGCLFSMQLAGKTIHVFQLELALLFLKLSPFRGFLTSFLIFANFWRRPGFLLHSFFYKQPHFRVEPRVAIKIPKMRFKVDMKLLSIFGIEAQGC